MLPPIKNHNQRAISIYLRQWKTENLFQIFKSRGFNFEETHITETVRLQKLMAFLAIGVAWSHKIGEIHASKHTILWKKFANSQFRPARFIFRIGFDIIRQALFNLQHKLIFQYFFCVLPHKHSFTTKNLKFII